MSGKGKSVDYKEALSIQVGNFLMDEGYGLWADNFRGHEGLVMRCTLSNSNSLGVLSAEEEDASKKKWLKRKARRQRREALGEIWFENLGLGANKRCWVLAAEGRGQRAEHVVLAEKLAEAFSVKVRVVLVREHSRTECRISDFHTGPL